MKSKDLKDMFQYFIILVLVVSMIILIGMLFKLKLPMENKDIALILIGAFATKFSDSVAFLINSSKGSAEKSETIAKLPPSFKESPNTPSGAQYLKLPLGLINPGWIEVASVEVTSQKVYIAFGLVLHVIDQSIK